MKNILLLALMFCTVVVGMAQGRKSVSITSQSQLVIAGDTNISGFRCDYNAYQLEKDYHFTVTEGPAEIVFDGAVLVLRNQGFDCGNRQINKDFHTLLRTEEYPEIQLELKKLSQIGLTGATADIRIQIAGKKKAYQVKVQKSADDCITGKLSLNIGDFDLQPPKKAFGLIKVKENIAITFNLYLEGNEQLTFTYER